MRFAFNEHNDKIAPFTGGRGFCPGCRSVVLAKCGDINEHHWAHDSLDDCDTKHYEPKTFWHRRWQEQFPVEDREVIRVKGDKFHIADILGKNDVVIEVQHSPLSTSEIEKREAFYEKMIWVLNARTFAHQLDVVGIQLDTGYHGHNEYVTYHHGTHQQLERVELRLPIDDDTTIAHCIQELGTDCVPDEYDDLTWYLEKNPFGVIPELPSKLRGAYHGHLLDERLGLFLTDTVKSHPIDFRWRSMRRTWLHAKMPVFLDIGPNLLIRIKYLYHTNFEGTVYTKRRFIEKYRKM